MEHLYLPPSLRYFTPLRTVNGGPGAHACLEYDLVEALAPELVVDVGCGDAVSFSNLCQSMKDHDVDGLAYAVDCSKDDEEDAGFASINHFLHTHFRFAYLLKQTPEEALAHFSSDSVDLLRIDARRAGRPLEPLLDAWLAKIRPGGFLLCDGITENPSDLAAFRARAPAGIVFATGLGVDRRGGTFIEEATHELVRWLSSGDRTAELGLGAYYAHAARHQTLKLEIERKGEHLQRKRRGSAP